MSKLYEPCTSFVVPAQFYALGDKSETWWRDSQNLDYHVYNDNDKLVKGKTFWSLYPFKPVGEEVKKENIIWLVDYSSIPGDEDKEWDFETHRPKGDPLQFNGENFIKYE